VYVYVAHGNVPTYQVFIQVYLFRHARVHFFELPMFFRVNDCLDVCPVHNFPDFAANDVKGIEILNLVEERPVDARSWNHMFDLPAPGPSAQTPFERGVASCLLRSSKTSRSKF
jgi:hypothetical protein